MDPNTNSDNSSAKYSIPRTVVVVRKTLETTFGFALQSYVFQRNDHGFTEQLTYVDYVRDKSPAAMAGDVVLSVNGLSVIGETHASLNITKIIQLSARSIQLAYILREKEIMLRILELEEKKLMKEGKNHGTGFLKSDEQSQKSEQSQRAVSQSVTRL